MISLAFREQFGCLLRAGEIEPLWVSGENTLYELASLVVQKIGGKRGRGRGSRGDGHIY